MINHKNKTPHLLPKTYSTFPINEIEPLGWLKNQLTKSNNKNNDVYLFMHHNPMMMI